MDEVLTQIWLLVDCLKKKKQALEIIVSYTVKQTESIINSPKDNYYFNKLVMEKQEHIRHVNDLDNVFVNIYERIKDFIGKGNAAHKDAMKELQQHIKDVADISIKIKTLEEKNSRMLTGGTMKPPKRLINSQRAVTAYKKNKKFRF